MHEMSIIQALIAQCEANAKKHGAKKVLKIEISVGKLSGVEAHYLQSAYSALKIGSICENAELQIKEQEIKAQCQNCDFCGELENNRFICPKCQKTELKIISGEDLMLDRLEME